VCTGEVFVSDDRLALSVDGPDMCTILLDRATGRYLGQQDLPWFDGFAEHGYYRSAAAGRVRVTRWSPFDH
jgi:hypothetical protein